MTMPLPAQNWPVLAAAKHALQPAAMLDRGCARHLYDPAGTKKRRDSTEQRNATGGPAGHILNEKGLATPGPST
jgi:hypothetical protein